MLRLVKGGSYTITLLLAFGSQVGCKSTADRSEQGPEADEDKSAFENGVPSGSEATSGEAAGIAVKDAGIADAGGRKAKKKMVFRPFEINPDEPCDHCIERICTDYNRRNLVEECEKGKGSNACKKVVACAQRTNCARERAADCYCGENGISECMSKGGTGPCKSEVEAASQTRDPKEIAVRFADPRYPMGRAMVLIECKKNNCLKCSE